MSGRRPASSRSFSRLSPSSGLCAGRGRRGTGLGVSAISAAIGLAFFAAYYTIINPEFVAAMQARGAAVDVPSQLAAVVMGSLVVGMAITVIATLIMRRGGQSE